ncbi:hypothetical protein SUGI_0694140 [Cryptomeria japonica]|uniref:oleosin G n=1 Tax=Cryptomeria japonica TaxID=3369 RepID=UPI0024149E00|nr:oleosin G [Cryptomeria japonica]GLJ34516.1 hypothetical protein SUGI_0694140 [Cryptomeria japonica]
MMSFRDFKMPKFDGGLSEILRSVAGLSYIYDHPPDSIHVLCFATLLTSSANLLLLAPLSVAGIAICLLILAPVLILLTPILIPLEMVLFLTVGGLIFGGIFGVAVILGVRWVYKYVNGENSGSVQTYYVEDRRPPDYDDVAQSSSVAAPAAAPPDAALAALPEAACHWMF